jgi:hypothetical protein
MTNEKGNDLSLPPPKHFCFVPFRVSPARLPVVRASRVLPPVPATGGRDPFGPSLPTPQSVPGFGSAAWFLPPPEVLFSGSPLFLPPGFFRPLNSRPPVPLLPFNDLSLIYIFSLHTIHVNIIPLFFPPRMKIVGNSKCLKQKDLRGNMNGGSFGRQKNLCLAGLFDPAGANEGVPGERPSPGPFGGKNYERPFAISFSDTPICPGVLRVPS